MALLDSKQLNPRLTGSFTLSGSIVGDSASTGSFNYTNTNKVQALDNSGLALYDNANIGIFVEDGGQIGIGTTSPGSALHIYKSDPTIRLQDSDGGDAHIVGVATDTFFIQNVDGSTNIAFTGSKSGFNTTTPEHELTVNASSGGGIKIAGSNTRLYFGTSGGTDRRALEGDTSGTDLLFSQGYNTSSFYGGVVRFLTDNARISGSSTSIGSFGSVYAATHITASGNISGSSSTTGSFGRLDTADSIYASGRIYESGTSVIDHATAMAIVFGG